MGTILTIIIGLYCIVVLFIIIEKKINKLPHSKKDWGKLNNDLEDQEFDQKLLDFSAGLKSSPFLDGYDRPDL